ncbi:hypothetical protein [Massilia aquatica]|uniref:Uncharacterized protein n=1 Tax=Massilia aquatica TaxID=2609000 RepID=A0ABX0MKB8_9BURK|nr:hypothetical protein [Massilia aquatica]NHZ43924.1 hypothetical protein [Massilia aquatica]
MNIKQLDADDTRVPMTCNGLLISDIDSFAALMDVADEQAARHPGTMILLTLDDLGQSEYTSGHAVSSLRLDDSDGYDTSKLDPAAYDNGEYLGDLATPSEFFILEGNFRKLCTGSDFAAACARGITIEDEELGAIDAINADPTPWPNCYASATTTPCSAWAPPASASAALRRCRSRRRRRWDAIWRASTTARTPKPGRRAWRNWAPGAAICCSSMSSTSITRRGIRHGHYPQARSTCGAASAARRPAVARNTA